MEEKPMVNKDKPVGIMRSLRDIPPAHYSLKIDSFSFLVNNKKIENYESGVFEAGGYKWKLSLYPNGNKKRNVNDHISLYLGMADTKALRLDSEVYVSFKLFVFDHIQEQYLSIQEAGIRRFHWMKTEWGFDKFISLETFNDATNGYLLDDCCVFGAEVFVVKNNGKGECVSLIKDPSNNIYTWKIEKVSALSSECHKSKEFVIGGLKWKLQYYAKGHYTFKNKSASLFLELADCERQVYAEYKLRIKNQLNENHKELGVEHWFCFSSKSWGYSDLMALSDLNNTLTGFLKNDAVIVEAQITQIFAFKYF